MLRALKAQNMTAQGKAQRRPGSASTQIFQALKGRHIPAFCQKHFAGAIQSLATTEYEPSRYSVLKRKHAMHLLRRLLTGAATLREGHIPVRVEDNALRDRLLAVKRSDLTWAQLDTWRKELHRDFEKALAETKLPERPDYEAANRFLIKARIAMVNP